MKHLSLVVLLLSFVVGGCAAENPLSEEGNSRKLTADGVWIESQMFEAFSDYSASRDLERLCNSLKRTEGSRSGWTLGFVYQLRFGGSFRECSLPLIGPITESALVCQNLGNISGSGEIFFNSGNYREGAIEQVSSREVYWHLTLLNGQPHTKALTNVDIMALSTMGDLIRTCRRRG